MKIKTTRKAIVEQSYKIISIGYCDACYLLKYHAPIAYTSGIYGWNFDVYDIDGVTICTGYRNMPGTLEKNVYEYNKKAKEVVHGTEPEAVKKQAVEDLLHEFINQC